VTRALSKLGKAWHAVFKGRHALRRAVLFLGGVGGLYVLASFVLAVAGAVPTAPVFFGANADNHYAWQIFFILPFIFAVWVLASGVLLALGRKGCRRSTVLAETAPAWGVPLLIAWVPSAIEAVFMALGMGQDEWVGILSEPGIWQTLYLAFFAAAAALCVRGFVLAGRKVHTKSWPLAILTAMAATAVAAGAYVLLVR
jgi:hypothetical protein